jgi:hypothetical protein
LAEVQNIAFFGLPSGVVVATDTESGPTPIATTAPRFQVRLNVEGAGEVRIVA